MGCNHTVFEEAFPGLPLFEIRYVDTVLYNHHQDQTINSDVIDTRGYRFEGCDKPLSLSILSQDIEALLDALHIQKAHAVIGSSLGGSTTITFAIQYPDRLDKFIACDILIDPTKANSTTEDPRVTLEKEYGMKAIAPQLVAADFTPQAVNSSEWYKALTMIGEASPDGAGAVSNLDNKFYQTVNVKDLRIPGLYVVGADDVRCVSFMQGFVAANPPNAGLRTIEGSHLCMMENGGGWVDAVEGFLRK